MLPIFNFFISRWFLAPVFPLSLETLYKVDFCRDQPNQIMRRCTGSERRQGRDETLVVPLPPPASGLSQRPRGQTEIHDSQPVEGQGRRAGRAGRAGRGVRSKPQRVSHRQTPRGVVWRGVGLYNSEHDKTAECRPRTKHSPRHSPRPPAAQRHSGTQGVKQKQAEGTGEVVNRRESLPHPTHAKPKRTSQRRLAATSRAEGSGAVTTQWEMRGRNGRRRREIKRKAKTLEK